MESEFEVLEHTADVGITAHGDSLEQAFAAAARGMFSLITKLDDIREAEQRDIALEASDRESLLVDWLNELIFLFDTENLLFTRFEVTIRDGTDLKGRCYGEKVDASRHEIRLGIKAATYHMLKIEENGGFRITTLFDI